MYQQELHWNFINYAIFYFLASNKNRPLDSIVTKLDFDSSLNEEHDKNTQRRYSEQGSALLELDVKVSVRLLFRYILSNFIITGSLHNYFQLWCINLIMNCNWV